MYAEMHDTPTHAKPRVSTRESAHAYLRERALPRALGKVWPSAGGCKSASRKKFITNRRIARVRCARASTEPREFAIVLIIIVSGQTVNRFAYVMNNPLSYTDPSGYFSLKKLFRAVVAIAIAVFAPQFLATYGIAGASPALAGFVNAAATGFLAGAASSGSLKGAIISAFTAGLFNLAGMVPGADSFERYLAHAAAGCISSVAGGGKCGQGAASAVFGKYSTNWMNDTFGKELSFSRGIAAAVSGGVGSVLGGGKFENGAVTAAYGYLFNEVATAMHEEMRNNGTGFHKYQTFSGCGAEEWCTKQNLLESLTTTPSLSQRFEFGGKGYSFAGPGFVTSDIDSNGVLNTTISGAHALSPGWVARTVEYRDGQWGIATLGMGYGSLPRWNERLASAFWKSMDNRVMYQAVQIDGYKKGRAAYGF